MTADRIGTSDPSAKGSDAPHSVDMGTHGASIRPLPTGEASGAAPKRGGYRPVLLQLLASKVILGHLQNRHQLMDPPMSDLRALAAGEAALLVRAMIAAAHADGLVDPQEHRAIIGALDTAALDAEERQMLENAIPEPPCLEALIRPVDTPRIAARFYAVSLRALDRSSKVNRAYLAYLAQRLALPADVVVRLNRQFGVPH